MSSFPSLYTMLSEGSARLALCRLYGELPSTPSFPICTCSTYVLSAVTVYLHTWWTFGISIVCQCFVCPVCVSVLLSHTVLSELYQEKLVTEDEVERLKGEEGDLIYRLFQYTIHSEEATRAAKVLEKYGYDFEASLLRGWWGSQTTQQWTQCNI